MTKTARKQEYQEIEANSHLGTQPDKVVTLHPVSQPEKQPDATEAQPSATETQPELTFPATKTAIAKVLKISRQQVTKYLTQLNDVYADFSDELETGKKVTQLGYEAIVAMRESSLNGQDYLNHLRKELEAKILSNSPIETSKAIVPSNPQSYAIKPMATSPLARYDAKIARAGELSEQVQEMGQVYSANNRIIAEQYLRSRVADAKQLRAIGDQLFLAELLGGQNELAEILAKEEEKQ